MKKTEKLELNLIEGTDKVDWEPLNENFETLESQISDFESTSTSDRKKIWSTLTSTQTNLGSLGKNLRFVSGTYMGTGTSGSSNPNSLTFDITPVFVYVWLDGKSPLYGPMLQGNSSATSALNGALTLTWSGKKVSWYYKESTNGSYYQCNQSNTTYRYLAFGYDE